ncbi:hypothetical protein DMH12_09770 [Streptomyces sp. WAC 04229]|uniref:hypothetical protein n=1 Tax=Streptomyces sp. WAC 04229 TaxID=2203206 RepID=UPI000F74804B|nr:hypothetical protein [Streptomyces sp. WAC 04229]RSN59801.1 hypothetical protein DMH12_09770 [Streptomyces sp. WAC 04229]
MDLQHTRDPRPSTAPAPLSLPAGLRTGLGHDAVGTSPDHGERILARLPRAGCVFADQERWWWIVPSGSDIGVAWPPGALYVSGDPSWTRARTETPPSGPRMVHGPDGDSPYTAPIPLYFLVCRLTGATPRWSPTP